MTAPATSHKGLKPLHNVHHFAFRCRDAEQTRWFYEDVLGLKLAIAFEEVNVFIKYRLPKGSCGFLKFRFNSWL